MAYIVKYISLFQLSFVYVHVFLPLIICSQSSMRICQHDAPVNIVYHALSQDHPLVCKEQRVQDEL